MREIRWLTDFSGKKILRTDWKRGFSTVILTIILLVSLGAMLSVLMGAEPGYSPTTYKCISCHNDTGYPNDTDLDGAAAPYKRPHNNTVMCESCHGINPHVLTFIQSDGGYWNKATAASCPECHQTGIPNANFTTANRIPAPLHHSTNLTNGSVWGSYWTSPKGACLFCHNKTLHNKKPLGRILEWYPDYEMNLSIGEGFTCSGCHYKGNDNWSIMKSAFASAGLNMPPEITNGTNWNGFTSNYYNHSLYNYTDIKCKKCHGSLLNANATVGEFVHSVAEAAGEECIGCHTSSQGDYQQIYLESFGKHRNINTSEGNDSLTNNDCMGCHYNFNYTEMSLPGFTTLTRTCTDCHIDGNYSAPVIANHRPPNITTSPGGRISTSVNCSTCHNNSINLFIYSANASVGHYGTNSSLIKPTVNQTPVPRYGFFNAAEAAAYNRECRNCHTPPNLSYGTPTNITYGHTSNGTCNQCHINAASDNLHNSSLGLPVTFLCKDCHTKYADMYKAPNLTGTEHADFTCQIKCHSPAVDYPVVKYLDVLADHNQEWTKKTDSNPTTDIVYLNSAPSSSLTVSKGTQVTVTSRIKDRYNVGDSASRVRGAEYYIDSNPGMGKGTFMEAADGMFNASNGNWENITGTIDTSGLSIGTHTVYVRCFDVGKQWSGPQSTTLIITPPLGFINGTVVDNATKVGIAGAKVTTNTSVTVTADASGFYSLQLSNGTYILTATGDPVYYPNSSIVATAVFNTTVVQDIELNKKPTGTIGGTVTSI